MDLLSDLRDDIAIASSSLSAVAESPTAPSQGSEARARKKTSTACSVCKKRKTKCSGEYPCDRCIQRGTVADCVIDSNADMRRKGVSERRTEELENSRRLLDGLIEVIRDGTGEHVQGVVDIIRARASKSELSSHIDSLLHGRLGIVGPFDGDVSMTENSQAMSPLHERRADAQVTHRKPRPSLHDLLNPGPSNS